MEQLYVAVSHAQRELLIHPQRTHIGRCAGGDAAFVAQGVQMLMPLAVSTLQ